MKTNNPNHFGKRTANQVKSILKSNWISASVENTGNGRKFYIGLESTIKNRYVLKKIGFILCPGKEGDKYILIEAF